MQSCSACPSPHGTFPEVVARNAEPKYLVFYSEKVEHSKAVPHANGMHQLRDCLYDNSTTEGPYWRGGSQKSEGFAAVRASFL